METPFCTDFWIYPLDRFLEIAGRVFKLDTKDAVSEAEHIKLVQQSHEDAMVRRRERNWLVHSRTAGASIPSQVDVECDPDIREAWEAWKDTVGDPNLRLTLKKRNYLRNLIAENGAHWLLTGIKVWTGGWLQYDQEDRVTPASATMVWDSLGEIIDTQGRGYDREVGPDFAPDDSNLGIDDIPF